MAVQGLISRAKSLSRRGSGGDAPAQVWPGYDDLERALSTPRAELLEKGKGWKQPNPMETNN